MNCRDADMQASEGGTTRRINDLLAEVEAAKQRSDELAGLLEAKHDGVEGKISALNQRMMLDTRLLLVVVEALIRNQMLDGIAVAAAFSEGVKRLRSIFDDAARVHAKHLAEQVRAMHSSGASASDQTGTGPVLVVDNLTPHSEGRNDC
ncbi:hypothetical protein [Rhizobium sp. SAFR-030]|uniref:hypothetical protein n=1 Tax=Rhizobium sp. SAFR-030 TaxID=3387277 RepID=UPI003F7D8A0F